MRVDGRGRITIPKKIRDQFGLGPHTAVEFRVVSGNILLRKALDKLNLAEWKGRCADSFRNLGYSSVDDFVNDVRGE